MATTKRIKALQTVRQLAQGNKEQAASRLQAQQQKLQLAEQQLAQLQTFYADYVAELQAPAKNNIHNARQVQQRYSFLARLDQTVTQQRAVLAAQQKSTDSCRDDWAVLYQRSEALDKAVQQACLQYRSNVAKRRDESA